MYDEAVEMMADDRCDSVRDEAIKRTGGAACAFPRGYGSRGYHRFRIALYVLSYVFLHSRAR
jgi:hypothetical protein